MTRISLRHYPFHPCNPWSIGLENLTCSQYVSPVQDSRDAWSAASGWQVPASEALLENNPSINTIYASNDLDEEQDFLSVIDAIQGEGFNPLWHQVLIVFNQGFAPHQFVSEDQVLAAAAGAHPEITLVSTDEVYRCSIVGSK